MAQLVKHPTPDFSSGHDLMVLEIEPCVQLHTEHGARSGFSLPLCAPPPVVGAFSQKKKKLSKTYIYTSNIINSCIQHIFVY